MCRTRRSAAYRGRTRRRRCPSSPQPPADLAVEVDGADAGVGRAVVDRRRARRLVVEGGVGEDRRGRLVGAPEPTLVTFPRLSTLDDVVVRVLEHDVAVAVRVAADRRAARRPVAPDAITLRALMSRLVLLPLASPRMPYEPAPVAIAVTLRRTACPSRRPRSRPARSRRPPTSRRGMSRITPLMPGEHATPPVVRTSTRCTSGRGGEDVEAVAGCRRGGSPGPRPSSRSPDRPIAVVAVLISVGRGWPTAACTLMPDWLFGEHRRGRL